MKFLLLLILSLCSIATLVLGDIRSPQNLFITNLQKAIHLENPHEIQDIVLEVRNDESEPVLTFVHIVPLDRLDKVAYVKASLIDSTYLHSVRFTHPVTGDMAYDIQLKQPLAPTETITLRLRLGYHRTLEPFPVKITQNEMQKEQYIDTVGFYSMYPIQQYRTSVHLPTDEVHSVSPRIGLTHTGQRLTYEQIIPRIAHSYDAGEVFTLHVSNPSPFAIMLDSKRALDVSQSGLISVAESYLLKHEGAQLTGPFHRFIHERNVMQRTKHLSAVSNLQATLPLHSYDIDLRDFNGNVSTSTVQTIQDKTILLFSLRFPLYGGWQSDFNINYNYNDMDLQQQIQQIKKQQQHGGSDEGKQHITLSIPFGYLIPTVSGDIFELQVLLPEGAQDVSWTTPFVVDEVITKTIVSYKDTQGRLAVIFRHRNIIPGMDEVVTISYINPSASVVKVPKLVYIVAAIVFIGLIISSIDWSLGSYSQQAMIDATTQQQGELVAAAAAAETTQAAATVAAAAAAAQEQQQSSGATEAVAAASPVNDDASKSTTAQRRNKKSSTKH